ncbi:MAG: AAA family ATPase [Acutalibacteraceae bacterium]|nr:AAA family ATPase [Acutalibacteraceae bacterium]
MIKIQNIENGEMMQVWQTRIDKSTGRIYFLNGTPSAKYLAKYPLTATGEKIGEDTVLTLNDGWAIVRGKGERKQRQQKPEAQPTAEPTVEDSVPVVTEEQSETVETANSDESPIVTTEQNEDDTTNEQALIAALKNLRGGAVDIAKVREIVAEELSKLVAADAKKAAKVIEAAKKNKGKKNEVYCAKFHRIVAKVSRGNNVYLYGPAGSGKSHTAEQVADALGLDFYGQTTIQFAHDVRGYGDAGGNFQETPFFKAFCYGGLYFQDEYDRSNAEAAIVLNSALANGWYDFPIVGRVEAHPNFRFMAAGNTLMTGADEEYVTGQEIDASSRDRFAYFFEVDYSHEVELRIAHGNENIVSFVEDVRQAIKDTGIKHVVSYRATAAMIDEVENENDLVACCDESVFKTLDVDARREIYERLNDKTNVWAKALKKLI